MANNPLETSFLDKAIMFAVKAHAGTERRGKGFPYIVHPLEAMEIVASISPDQELLAAAALHDTIEDTDITVADIRREFGERVAELVEAESDKFAEGVSEEDSWHQRKQAAIDRLAQAPFDAKIVAMGDKLSNMRAICRDYIAKGDELWKIFHIKERADHEWHYHGLADSLRELADTDAYAEFVTLFKRVFGNGNDEGWEPISFDTSDIQALAAKVRKTHSAQCDTVLYDNIKRYWDGIIENSCLTDLRKAELKAFVHSVPAAQTCLCDGCHYGNPLFDLGMFKLNCPEESWREFILACYPEKSLEDIESQTAPFIDLARLAGQDI